MPAQILRLAAVLKVRVRLFFKRRMTSAPKMTNGVNQVMILELSTEGGGYVQFIGHTQKNTPNFKMGHCCFRPQTGSQFLLKHDHNHSH